MSLRLSDHTLRQKKSQSKDESESLAKNDAGKEGGKWDNFCLAVLCHHSAWAQLSQTLHGHDNLLRCSCWLSEGVFSSSSLPWHPENIGLYRTNRPLYCVLNKSSTVLEDLSIAYFYVIYRSYVLNSHFPDTPGSVSSIYTPSHFKENYCVKA